MTESKKVSGPPPAAAALAPPIALPATPLPAPELAPVQPVSISPVADTERPPVLAAPKPGVGERTGALKSVETWATEKGHIVVRKDGERDVTARDYWKFRAAQAGQNWPNGLELTEAEYDGAVDDATKVEVR